MTILSLWRAAPAALFLLLFTACSGGGETDSGEGSNEPVEDSAAAGDSEPEGSAAVDASASDAPSKIDIEATRETARTAMFIPAPSEFQAALNASDVQIDIRKLMVDSDRDLSGKSRSIVALETGVRMATVLMTAQDGEKSATVTRMKSAREGLVALSVPAGVLEEVDKVIADFEADKISAAELTPSLDILAQQIQDDLGKQSDPNTATLVQAGGWLQGAHLLSTSLSQAGQTGDAAALLNQPTVLAHFKEFLGKSGGGEPAIETVMAEMAKLEEIAGKPALTAEDLAAVSTHTGTILEQF